MLPAREHIGRVWSAHTGFPQTPFCLDSEAGTQTCVRAQYTGHALLSSVGWFSSKMPKVILCVCVGLRKSLSIHARNREILRALVGSGIAKNSTLNHYMQFCSVRVWSSQRGGSASLGHRKKEGEECDEWVPCTGASRLPYQPPLAGTRSLRWSLFVASSTLDGSSSPRCASLVAFIAQETSKTPRLAPGLLAPLSVFLSSLELSGSAHLRDSCPPAHTHASCLPHSPPASHCVVLINVASFPWDAGVHFGPCLSTVLPKVTSRIPSAVACSVLYSLGLDVASRACRYPDIFHACPLPYPVLLRSASEPGPLL